MTATTTRVILKRLPHDVTPLPAVDDDAVSGGDDDDGVVEVRCVCVDPVFGMADPQCPVCGGRGVVKASVAPAPAPVAERPTDGRTAEGGGVKRVWVSSAEIVVDSASAIYDDEEEIVISDVHAFFSPDEDVEVGDIVIPEGSRVSYIVTSVTTVRDANNVITKDCALETISNNST